MYDDYDNSNDHDDYIVISACFYIIFVLSFNVISEFGKLNYQNK